ncbi:KUP/HAK/KT family potassium transporter [Akkermansiaceae bacterium]|nr:KUP/HAK/KT family potassium transporter [Akkermansiaceae bacterium]
MNPATSGQPGHTPKIAATTIAALGIVFGDIGTSPLYAFRECFSGPHGVHIDPRNLIGAASLVVWSLLLVVSVKYLFIILKLDNKGEGGILALSALIRGATKQDSGKRAKKSCFFGLAGAALIYADGMLTPAISVLSAVEGLSVSAPMLAHWAVPAAVGILATLFAIQRFGTGKVGVLFGPIVLLWFATIGFLGLRGIINQPQVLLSLSPVEGLGFLIREWTHAFPLLAAVFLAVTGGEALYADLGHFGARPIRIGWFSLVLPCLVLNYLGQAALLTADAAAIRSPFFLLAPQGLRFPLTLLATAAAIIASQALITGAFSLTTQAIQLGCLPRFLVRHTSVHSAGQVYVPMVNWMLAFSCILLVVTFETSAALAGAYGIAIALTMAITSILFFSAARAYWHWSFARAFLLTAAFLVIDGAFLAANALKIAHGGWLPLVVGGAVMGLMLIWIWGRERLYKRIMAGALPVRDLLAELAKGRIHRVGGTAVYMSGKDTKIPNALLHNLKHNQVLHQQVILLHVSTSDEPHASGPDTLSHEDLGEGVHRITLQFGFADTPDVPLAFKQPLPDGLQFNPAKATYFLGRETYGIGKNAGLFDRARLFLFAIMARNASPATAYFKLPPGRVVELGSQVTL